MKNINNQNGLNSIWTKSLARNLHPNGNALVDHLKTIHQENTGFTEACASSCRDEAGRNSYEWLSEVVPDNASLSVLDLACGSGPLLTLMDPIAPVLDEVRRVLTSEGRFAALVDGPMNAASGYAEVHDLIYSYVQEEIPSYGEIDLGDPRIRGSESLSNLTRKAFPEASVTIETNVVSMEGPVTKVAEIASGFFYAAFILKPEKRKLMIKNLSDMLAISKVSTDNERQGRFSMPISRLLVRQSIK